MRAFALSGFAALAISMMAPATVWAFSTEQASPNGGAAANLADEADPLKALQDKVDGKTSPNTERVLLFSRLGAAAAIQPEWLQNQ